MWRVFLMEENTINVKDLSNEEITDKLKAEIKNLVIEIERLRQLAEFQAVDLRLKDKMILKLQKENKKK